MRLQSELGVAVNRRGHFLRQIGRQSLRLVDLRQLLVLLLGLGGKLVRLQVDQPLEQLALHLHRNVLTSAHRERAG